MHHVPFQRMNMMGGRTTSLFLHWQFNIARKFMAERNQGPWCKNNRWEGDGVQCTSHKQEKEKCWWWETWF